MREAESVLHNERLTLLSNRSIAQQCAAEKVSKTPLVLDTATGLSKRWAVCFGDLFSNALADIDTSATLTF